MSKKYYWLKLKQDFFDNLRMKKLRSIAGGDTYTIIYLKMQLLSLQNEGFLYFEGVEESFEQELALLINENVEDVKITINFLIRNNLMEEIENGKFELIETRSCIGSETDKAEFMRNLRNRRQQELLKNGNNVTNLLPNVTKCYTEKEIDIEKEKNRKEVVDVYNSICTNLSKIQKITDKRTKSIDNFIKEFTIEQFKEICEKANTTDFLTGKNDRGWKADFDFLMRIDKATAILEDKYSTSKTNKKESNFEQRKYDELGFLYANKDEE